LRLKKSHVRKAHGAVVRVKLFGDQPMVQVVAMRGNKSPIEATTQQTGAAATVIRESVYVKST
jgi:hypothetical protein